MKQNTDLEGAKKIMYETNEIAFDVERNLGDQNIRAVSSQEKVSKDICNSIRQGEFKKCLASQIPSSVGCSEEKQLQS